MNEINYSKAMAIIDEDRDLFFRFVESLDETQIANSNFSADDYEDFYKLFKERKLLDDKQLNYIINNQTDFIGIMTATWTDMCKNNKNIDKDEFITKYMSVVV